MANRRMYSKTITESDQFLDMSLSTQALYFHLGMQADDDGFVSPNRVLRMIGAQNDELKILCAKQFVIPFETGVVVIRHWKENNYIQSDRKKGTVYSKELASLSEDRCGVYNLDTQCIQNVHVGKDRIGEERVNTVANATDSLILTKTIMDEIEYISLEEKPSKSKYGKSTMLILAKTYLETKGVKLEAGENYDANKISKSLSKIYNEANKDADETMRRLWLGSEYYKVKGIDWAPETIWKNWEIIRQWEYDGKPGEKQQRELKKKLTNLDNNPLYE